MEVTPILVRALASSGDSESLSVNGTTICPLAPPFFFVIRRGASAPSMHRGIAQLAGAFFMNASYHRPAELELCALRRAAPSFDCGQDIEAAFGTMSAGD